MYETERRTFGIQRPIREIREDDMQQEFKSSMFDACGITMRTLYGDNLGDTHVWVFDWEGSVASAAKFVDYRDHICLDVISNNYAIPKGILREMKPGGAVYKTIEDASTANGIPRITLDSIPEKVDYWRSHGFRIYEPSFDGRYCRLYPMEKRL